MAKTFNETLQEYVNLPYEKLLEFAKISMGKIASDMDRILGENVGKAYSIITAACFGVDAKLTELECKFLNDLLDANWSMQEIHEQLSGYDQQQIQNFTDAVVDNLTGESKTALVMFCMSMLAVDETITRDEAAFIAKLLA